MTEPNTLDMDKIVEILKSKHGMDNAYVEQTGGGCATIFGGEVRPDEEEGFRYAVAAGPGDYGWGKRPSTIHTAEFCVGRDGDEEWSSPAGCDLGVDTEEKAAALIALIATLDGAEPTSAQYVALGLDPDLNSAPQSIREDREISAAFCRANNAVVHEQSDAGVHPNVYGPIAQAAGEAAAEVVRRRIAERKAAR